MKQPWRRGLTSLVVAMLALWIFPGCEDSSEMSEDDMILSANDSVQGGGEDRAPLEEENIEESFSHWPEGWMVVHREEWIPLLDDLGQRLYSARRAFLNGDQRAVSADVRSGLVFLEAQVSDASERDRAALERSIALLRAIDARLTGGEEVTLEQLDIAFTNAYLSDLQREALVVQTNSTLPYLEQPDRHLQRAVELFLANEIAEAAREIDRASAYLYLEGDGLGLSERAQLNEAAQRLEYTSARMRLEEIRERAELDSVFEAARQTWRQHAVEPSLPRSLNLTP